MTDDGTLAGQRIAIANRGEIAIRIAQTSERLGMIPVLLLGDPDLDGLAARRVGRVERVGEAGAELDVERVIAAAERTGAAYLHPGYGFLSERAELAEACEAAGIRFVGPSAATLRLCGDKLETRAAAVRAGVPVLTASEPLGDDSALWIAAAAEVGYPLIVKPAGAGGGRGLRHVADETALVGAIEVSRREGASSGAGAVLYVERELLEARHVEVQLAGDGLDAIAVGLRDCSLQRRHQKVIEESPAPCIDDDLRQRLHGYARDLAREVELRGIGTCEFLLDADGTLAFLEINPRIQVEHPVTELVTGIDLVAWQLELAAGGGLPRMPFPEPRGHAVEARVYAEDPREGFRPSPGRLAVVQWPRVPNVRVDAGYETGDSVPHAYDAMLAKVIAHGPDRQTAIATLRQALRETVIAGVHTNLAWLDALLASEAFREGRATTQTAGEIVAGAAEPGLAPVVALLCLLGEGAALESDPWMRLGPWRIAGPAPVLMHGDDWEARFTVERSADGWAARDAAGRPVRWWRDAAGVITVAAGAERGRFFVVPEADALRVCGNGGEWRVRSGPRPLGPRERVARSHNGEIVAPMPANVIAVNVMVGDRVEPGAPLVTLTAMKMEITCEAPAAGTVTEILCAPGDLVGSDQVLARLATEDALGASKSRTTGPVEANPGAAAG
jgi:acetyl-CoA/propionyl-CoA carboxylase, biotin carboxylase, biotin carboxyl carrier protein